MMSHMNTAAGTVTHIYVGRRETFLAEIGQHMEIYEGKWLVYPYCSNGDATYDAQAVGTKREAMKVVRDLLEHYPAAEVFKI